MDHESFCSFAWTQRGALSYAQRTVIIIALYQNTDLMATAVRYIRHTRALQNSRASVLVLDLVHYIQNTEFICLSGADLLLDAARAVLSELQVSVPA